MGATEHTRKTTNDIVGAWKDDWGPIVTSVAQKTGLSTTEALLFMDLMTRNAMREMAAVKAARDSDAIAELRRTSDAIVAILEAQGSGEPL